MIIKKLAFAAVTSLAFFACKSENAFEIKGRFEHATAQSKVYLYALNKAEPTAIDSTVLSEKGEFRFSHASPEVNFFKVAAGSNEYMLIAKDGDHIEMSADLTDPNMQYKISGAEEADKLESLNVTKNKHLARINAVQKKFDDLVAQNPEKREEIMERIRPEYTKEINDLNAGVLKFAQENVESLAGFYAINLLNPAEYETEMVAYSDKIKSKFNHNSAVTEFLVRMAKLKSVQVGQMAPAFTIDGIDGNKINLSDFKGKYVLLDFWASWCQPCRVENPNVVKAYQEFKDKNFTVFGVSLDKDRAAWQQAIKADQLTWPHGGELMDFEGPVVRLYQVDAIPTSFIIDPEGKIIAKNLRGADLENFLRKTL